MLLSTELLPADDPIDVASLAEIAVTVRPGITGTKAPSAYLPARHPGGTAT